MICFKLQQSIFMENFKIMYRTTNFKNYFKSMMIFWDMRIFSL